MGLSTVSLEELYKLKWLDEGSELKVRKKVVLPFSIGQYHDTVEVDIILMQACHLLSRRSWQFDRDVKNNVRVNTYTFAVGEKRFALQPLKPSEIGSLAKEIKGVKASTMMVAEVHHANDIKSEIMANNRDFFEGD